MDLVERAAVIEIIANSGNDLEYYAENNELQDEIRRLPSATRQTDSCENCVFIKTEEWEMPCAKCRRMCRDYWRRGQ